MDRRAECNAPRNQRTGSGVEVAVSMAHIPEGVRATLTSRHGEYDARRLRSQRDIIRDVMLAAADCNTWLTLSELRALTRYGEASISAQLRHLRKLENGGYDVVKRHREGASPERTGADGRGECVWEYRVSHEVRAAAGEIPDDGTVPVCPGADANHGVRAAAAGANVRQFASK